MEKYIVEVCENVTFWKNKSGQLHRLGGQPAIEWTNGHKEYWESGKRHRLGGLPAVEYADGSKAYYENGQLHRLGGLPAVEFADGHKAYWENDQCHRLGGKPALEWANGYKEYYENGIQLTEAEAEAKCNPKPADSCDGKLVTIEGKQYKLTAL